MTFYRRSFEGGSGDLVREGACFQSRGHREPSSIIVALERALFPLSGVGGESPDEKRVRRRFAFVLRLICAQPPRRKPRRKFLVRLINDRQRPRDARCPDRTFRVDILNDSFPAALTPRFFFFSLPSGFTSHQLQRY